MKKKLFILTIVLLALYSCGSDTVSYSELQDKEQKNIKEYIKRNKIKIVKEMPQVDKWAENLYYKSESGLYFHLISKGDTTIQVKNNSIISIRFLLSKIDKNNTLLIRNWDPQDFSTPEKLKISDLSYNPSFGIGVQEALRYMKNKQSEAIIIVESALNTNSYKNSVTPVKYQLKITSIQ